MVEEQYGSGYYYNVTKKMVPCHCVILNVSTVVQKFGKVEAQHFCTGSFSWPRLSKKS
jgi:hypothetical protein